MFPKSNPIINNKTFSTIHSTLVRLSKFQSPVDPKAQMQDSTPDCAQQPAISHHPMITFRCAHRILWWPFIPRA